MASLAGDEVCCVVIRWFSAHRLLMIEEEKVRGGALPLVGSTIMSNDGDVITSRLHCPFFLLLPWLPLRWFPIYNKKREIETLETWKSKIRKLNVFGAIFKKQKKGYRTTIEQSANWRKNWDLLASKTAEGPGGDAVRCCVPFIK